MSGCKIQIRRRVTPLRSSQGLAVLHGLFQLPLQAFAACRAATTLRSLCIASGNALPTTRPNQVLLTLRRYRGIFERVALQALVYLSHGYLRGLFARWHWRERHTLKLSWSIRIIAKRCVKVVGSKSFLGLAFAQSKITLWLALRQRSG